MVISIYIPFHFIGHGTERIHILNYFNIKMSSVVMSLKYVTDYVSKLNANSLDELTRNLNAWQADYKISIFDECRHTRNVHVVIDKQVGPLYGTYQNVYHASSITTIWYWS